jgi:Ca2+-dependent lipid-binding protein
MSQDTQVGQSQNPNLTLEFANNLNVSLWDYDTFSNDDLLGSITILESERGMGDLAKLASSPVESSAYYVVYRVD